MALFVDFEDEDSEPPQHLQPAKLIWSSTAAVLDKASSSSTPPSSTMPAPPSPPITRPQTAIQSDASPPTSAIAAEKARAAADPNVPNWNSMTEALGCYPIASSVASNLDLNSLDSLSRTCRQIRSGLLQFRKPLLASTLRCINDARPVDVDDSLRFRAQAGNWFYMEDRSRTDFGGKAGQCARDMVSACRRCGTVVCRNCAIKPPAPIVLRDRHRRLCDGCVKAPLATLTRPPLAAGTPLHAEAMQQAICSCATDGVWLCQSCGRSIRGADYDYKAVWKWRTQYGEILGGLGTGIGDGDCGVNCGREKDCCCAKEREQETDCDAEDAREAEGSGGAGGNHGLSLSSSIGSYAGSSTLSVSSITSAAGGGGGGLAGSAPSSPPAAAWAIPVAPATQAAATVGSPLYSPEVAAALVNRRTPSPALGPGYARHEIEGIGGVVKRKRVRMVRVAACVPDWEDERARGTLLEREITGKVRSWCGWCFRPIPGEKDVETDGL